MTSNHSVQIKHINYRSEAKLFSNRCLVNIDIISGVANLIEGTETVDARALLNLSILSEAVVFNESLAIEDDVIINSDVTGLGDYDTGTVELVKILENAYAVDKIGYGAGSIMDHEMAVLAQPGMESARVGLIHGSHILIETSDNPNSHSGRDDPSFGNWRSEAKQAYSKEYLAAIGRYGYYGANSYGRILAPWKLLADCHGIPYITDTFYTLRDSNLAQPTNIGIDLYRKLEQLHISYFKKIRKYLGPTYVYIPPILSLVLQRCGSPDGIPQAMLDVRAQYADLRTKCTEMEVELRRAESLSEQIEIIQEIESAYGAIANKLSARKTRLLLRLFDILKEVDPVHIGTASLAQAKDYLVEQETLLKMPGYYNLWKASVEVKQGLPLLRRVFRGQITPSIVADMNSIMDSISGKSE